MSIRRRFTFCILTSAFAPASAARPETFMARVLFFFVMLAWAMGASTQAPTSTGDRQRHIDDLIQSLPPDSVLRGVMERGGHADGVHRAWMDEMKQQGIKRVLIEVHFVWKHGPKQMDVSRVKYFASYANENDELTDAKSLEEIRASGLEQRLKDEAIPRAARGFWIDHPKPRPKPFMGGTWVELFDDEWLFVEPPRFWVRTPSNSVSKP